MSDRDLFYALVRKTEENFHEIARRGGFLIGLDRPRSRIPGTQVNLAGFRAGFGAPAEKWRGSFENIEDVIAWLRGRPFGVARG